MREIQCICFRQLDEQGWTGHAFILLRQLHVVAYGTCELLRLRVDSFGRIRKSDPCVTSAHYRVSVVALTLFTLITMLVLDA